MARALRAWAINRGGKNSVRNLRYGPRTRLVRGMYFHVILFIMLYKAALNFKSVEKTLVCDHSIESYGAVLSCGTVYDDV